MGNCEHNNLGGMVSENMYSSGVCIYCIDCDKTLLDIEGHDITSEQWKSILKALTTQNAN